MTAVALAVEPVDFDPALFIPRLEKLGYSIKAVFHKGWFDGISTHYPESNEFGADTLYREYIVREEEAKDGAERTIDWLIETGRVYGFA